ncbi:MAG: hypothetical protein KAU20_05735 [Nanoarchaeota archaeon]|nr:hypothetical protein [Nanoarchaeota archaeon]
MKEVIEKIKVIVESELGEWVSADLLHMPLQLQVWRKIQNLIKDYEDSLKRR